MTTRATYSNTPLLFSSLKWLAAALTVFACTSSWADKNVQAPRASDLLKTVAAISPSPATSSLTTFVDGPTGYVFVYTVEGWKFVSATKN